MHICVRRLKRCSSCTKKKQKKHKETYLCAQAEEVFELYKKKTQNDKNINKQGYISVCAG